jgi:hypothetical protein
LAPKRQINFSLFRPPGPPDKGTEKRLSLFVEVKSVREDGTGAEFSEDLPAKVTEGSTERWTNAFSWANSALSGWTDSALSGQSIDSLKIVRIEKSDGSIVVLMSVNRLQLSFARSSPTTEEVTLGSPRSTPPEG